MVRNKRNGTLMKSINEKYLVSKRLMRELLRIWGAPREARNTFKVHVIMKFYQIWNIVICSNINQLTWEMNLKTLRHQIWLLRWYISVIISDMATPCSIQKMLRKVECTMKHNRLPYSQMNIKCLHTHSNNSISNSRW